MIIFIAILTIIFVYFCIHKPLQYWEELNIPFVKPWPVFGNLHRIIFRLDFVGEWLQNLYNSQDSKIFGIYNFNIPMLLVKDLNLIKQIGIKDFDHFVDRRAFISEEIDPLFGKNLLSLKGDRWRHMRATLSPAFTSSKMRLMFVLISESAKKLSEYFDKIVDQQISYEIELKDIFTRFANDVIATTAFGIECDSLEDKNNEFYLMGKEATNFGGLKTLKFFGYECCPSLMRLLNVKIFSSEVCQFFKNIIKNTVDVREKKNIFRPDMIQLMMDARKGNLKHDKSKDDDAGFATVDESDIGKSSHFKQNLTDDDITAQALLFFIGGFDTISSAMCHMAYELAQHEDIQEKLQKEIDEASKTNKGEFSYNMILKLKYLDMVLCETLRKWPPLPSIDRICVTPYIIKPNNSNDPGIKINKDIVVIIPIFAIHRDPKYFPEPDKFNPERFNDENKNNIIPMSYMPFGLGPRNCIGSRFALLEAKTVFVYLLSKFKFVLTEKSQIPLQIRKDQFILNAEKGFWVALKKRSTEI